jgi:hypothetical protein
MSNFNLETQYEYTLNSRPRGKDLTTPILNTCNIPHKTLVVDYNSNCLLCQCDGWLPIPVGKVKDFNSLEEVFSSPIAKIFTARH